MTSVSAIRNEPTRLAPDRSPPTRDTEQRFEDALARKTDDDAEGGTASASRDKTPEEPTVGALVQQHPGNARDEGDQRRASRGLDDVARPEAGSTIAAPADSRASAAPATIPAQSGAMTLPTSYAEMALRMALPQGVHGGETSLLITDPRSIAAYSVISHDPAGQLSVDIGAQHGGSSEQQRQELKARLEARGHRVGRIGVDLLDR